MTSQATRTRRRGLGRAWRTVRHLRTRQILALARHRLGGEIVPVAEPEAPPSLVAGPPVAPFLGAPAHASSDGVRRFRLLNREVVFPEAVDWDEQGQGPLWAYHLHQFDYLRRPGLAPATRTELALDWISRHRRGVGWNPHPTCLRILAWGKLLLTPGALALDPGAERRVRASLASQVETLDRHLEVHLLANHYLSNLLAVVFAGLLFEGTFGSRWLRREGRLRAELAEQVRVDGMHVERSPMYHALLLESILDLVNIAGTTRGRASAKLETALRDVAARMLGALRVVTHPDGRIALFGDSALGIAQEPAALGAYASQLGVAPKGPAREGVLDAGGFVRLAAGPFTLIASVAGPRPPYQPGHAHADALSFELSVGRTRAVVDPGVCEYIPGWLRDASRATAWHATAEVGGLDQAELWAAHRIGGRPHVERVAVEPGRAVEATCAGWATRDTLHRRRFSVSGEAVEILDRFEGRPRPVRLALPLAPESEVALWAGGARVYLADGAALEVELSAGLAWRVESGPCFPEFGRRLERPVLVGRADRLGEARWRLRRVR